MADRTRGDIRFGWGPSELASPEEREFYEAQQIAQQIRAGQATVADLPEAYGGRPKIISKPRFNESGEPIGSFRRQLRMQEMWDTQQRQALEQERIRQQMQKEEQMFQLDYASKQYDLLTKQNENIFNLRKDADLKRAEAEFTEFRNKLDPNDPMSSGMIYSYISSDPRLANSKVAYTSAEFFNKAAENSATSIALKQQEDLNTATSEARRAGIAEDQINKVIVGSRERDDQGNEFTNFNKALAEITKLTDTVIGKRAIGEEERKEGRGEYRPMSVEQAQDEFDIANAEFGAIQEAGLDEEDPDFVKAQGRLRRAEAQLNVSKERSQTAERPKREGPKIPSITSKEELDALPSGSEYIAPNGKRYRKK